MLPKSWARRLKTHESTQRAVCRCALICGVIVPLVLNAVGSVYWSTPWYRQRFVARLQTQISQACGTAVKLESARYLTPHRIELRKIQMMQPESDQAMLDAEVVTIEQAAQQWIIRANSASIDAQVAVKLSRAAYAWFLCRQETFLPAARIIFETALIKTPSANLPSGRLEMQFSPAFRQSTFQLRYEPEAKEDQIVDLKLERSRESTGKTTVQLESNNFPVPLEMVYDLVPTLKKFGAASTFAGSAVWIIDSQERSMFRGLIDRCEWENLTQDLSYHASGAGAIWIEQATLANQQIEIAEGTLYGGVGSISTEWLVHANELLSTPLRSGSLLAAGPVRPFSGLKVSFHLDRTGVMIRGFRGPQKDSPNVLIADGSGPLLYQSNLQNNSLGELTAWIAATPKIIYLDNGVRQAAYSHELYSRQISPVAASLSAALPFPAVETTPR